MVKTYFICDIKKEEFARTEPQPGVYVSYHDYMELVNKYNDIKFTSELYGGKEVVEKLKRFPKIKGGGTNAVGEEV